jgi:hypothetical protein
MAIDLILKDIEDKYVRENFFRLSKYIREQVVLDGQWKFYELEFLGAVSNFRYKHGLTFIPKDTIILAIDGDRNFYFNYDLFDAEFIDITCYGPCRIRFLAGAYREKFRGVTGEDLTDVPIGISPTLPPVGAAAKLIETFNTDVATAVGNLVRVTGANTVTKIVSNSFGQIPNGVFGVVISKPSTVLAQVLFSGIMGGYAGFTTGSPLFVSTGGVPSHSIPAAGVVQQIGFAISSTEFFIHLMLPVVRN